MFYRCLYRSGKTTTNVVHQNILSTVMVKNVKLSYGKVRFHQATPEIKRNRLVSHKIFMKILQESLQKDSKSKILLKKIVS